jgi:hypothetical protein
MAPAGIQKQWQRIFIQAYDMRAGESTPTAGRQGISPYWSFDPNTQQDVEFDIGIPLDWEAGSDAYAYPVFYTDVDLFATVRWGIQYLPMTRGMSIVGTPYVMEGNFAANGTGIVIPPKSQWLTLVGSGLIGRESLFQMDDFTALVNLQCKWYRAAASPFDNHPGNARLLGVAFMYRAFI